MITVEITGYEGVINDLKKLASTGEKYMMKAVEETAIESVSVMKKNMPVVTNRLRSSAHWEKPTTRSFIYKDRVGNSYNGSFSERVNGIQAIFGTNVEYAEKANATAKDTSKRNFYEKAEAHARQMFDTRLRINLNKAIDEALSL